LTVYEGQLIAGGVFATAGETSAICIAAWDGSSWSALGEGINDDVRDDVYALTVYDGKLIAGGFFIEEWGAVGNHVAAWDGSAWSRLGSGIYGSVVDALAVYDKSLMVGGRFSAAGNKASYNLAEWTKTSVATLLQSFAASCRGSAVELSWELSEQVPRESFVIERAERPGDFAELRGVEIAANGLRYSFTDADIEPGTMCRYRVSIAKEDASREILFETEGISIPAMPVTLFQNHPNPFNPSTIVRYYLPQSADVTLGVYDARGRLVVSLVEREKQAKGYYEVAWDGRDARGQAVASGVYFSRLRAGKLTESRKMILLK
jgi:hypothetical protein